MEKFEQYDANKNYTSYLTGDRRLISVNIPVELHYSMLVLRAETGENMTQLICRLLETELLDNR